MQGPARVSERASWESFEKVSAEVSGKVFGLPGSGEVALWFEKSVK